MNIKNKIREGLLSDNEGIINQTIDAIDKSKNIGLIAEVIDVILEKPEGYMAKEAISFVSNIKDKNVIQILIDKLISSENNSHKALICRIIWESPLDFSNYTKYFIDIVFGEHLESAIEAYSIILNINNMDKDTIAYFKSKMKNPSTKKSIEGLVSDLNEHIESMIL